MLFANTLIASMKSPEEQSASMRKSVKIEQFIAAKGAISLFSLVRLRLTVAYTP